MCVRLCGDCLTPSVQSVERPNSSPVLSNTFESCMPLLAKLCVLFLVCVHIWLLLRFSIFGCAVAVVVVVSSHELHQSPCSPLSQYSMKCLHRMKMRFPIEIYKLSSKMLTFFSSYYFLSHTYPHILIVVAINSLWFLVFFSFLSTLKANSFSLHFILATQHLVLGKFLFGIEIDRDP